MSKKDDREPVLSESEGDRLIRLYREFRAAETAWNEARKAACFGRTHGTLLVQNGAGQATVVIGQTTTYDTVKAEEILSPAWFRRVTVRKIDPALLRSALETGKVTQEQYRAIVTTKNNSAFPKITLK
jgi:hypothetical protein